MLKKNILLTCIMLIFTLLLSSCEQKRPQIATIGKLAPDFKLTDTKGREWNLKKLKGKVVFVNFWATWCPPCREEMPSMQELYTSLPADKFQMLSILSNDEPAFADLTAQKLGTTFPILIDPENATGQAYGITGVPETYIIDPQGVLREKFIGPVQWNAPGARQLIMKYIQQQ